ncbi:putative lipoprotein [Priestia megaterium]|uniref:Putative lipoprotein n=1 Tax=Priestia megaterium (strain ATCC 14581 / DSM 32 / CCUG 1817 / JCM 2506 / NBRC 15308 / NCIMB 9376 / NCTC 10342 / NRRL B-14308 / VKM B-512 / Ford 19) TaxID=1348623 RepID=A0A0B6B0K6_PRIM2|nr:putative lipoprotein [Priestia megaterium NBRC 15308 = ATCC 14581]KFM95453.1 putative lipoprotein [Priestia megaterium]SUX82142.1 Uncharacterised protein [Priestia megaterium]
MKNLFIKLITIFTLLMITLCVVSVGKTEAASKTVNQDFIIINKHYNLN